MGLDRRAAGRGAGHDEFLVKITRIGGRFMRALPLLLLRGAHSSSRCIRSGRVKIRSKHCLGLA